MAKLSTVEINSIREIVGCHQTASRKLSDYAQACQDPQIRQMFTQSAGQAKKSAQDLINHL